MTTITALPTPPSRQDPVNFSSEADAFLGALPAFGTEANALASEVNAAASSASSSASSATTAKNLAEAASAAAIAAANAPLWVSGTTYAVGDAVISPVDLQTYRRKIAGAGTTDPSLDSTNWSNLSSDFTGRTWNGNTVDVAHGGTGATTITGLVRGNGTSAMTAAVAGTHYQAPIGTISGIAKGNGANALTSAVAGTDYQAPITATGILKGAGAGSLSAATAGTDYQAAITGVGILKGAGSGSVSAATANTDYLVPNLANTAVTGFKTATFNSQPTTPATSGPIAIDWSAAQNYKQNEPTGNLSYTFTAPPGICHLQLYIASDGTSTARTITWPASVIWYNVWTHTANKKAIINFFYDGTNYHAMGSNQI